MKRKAQKSELEAWQREDAERLRELIYRAKRRADWQGMDEFAAAWLGKSGSFLSQLVSGYRPLNLEHAVRLAKGLGVDVSKISPTLASPLADEPAARIDPSALRLPSTNRRRSELDRAVFRALETLEPDVQMSIKSMILALATAKNPNHAQWSSSIEKFNHSRDSKAVTRKRKAGATDGAK